MYTLIYQFIFYILIKCKIITIRFDCVASSYNIIEYIFLIITIINYSINLNKIYKIDKVSKFSIDKAFYA